MSEAVEPEVMEPEAPSHALTPRREAPVESWSPSPLAEMSDEEFNRRLAMAKLERDRLAQIQKAVMTKDTDYGVIPGTQKPSLLKPGAEVLNKMARLVPSYEVNAMRGDGIMAPPIHYRVTCRLHRDNTENPVEYEGVGTCNSWEKKYRYRSAGPPCPDCSFELRRSKHDDEWYCWKKKGGCGAKFPLGQFSAGGTTENADPYELDNTLLKMAKKRAHVDATLTAHAASGIFTQDVEPTTAAEPEAPAPPRQPTPEPPDEGPADEGAAPGQPFSGKRITSLTKGQWAEVFKASDAVHGKDNEEFKFAPLDWAARQMDYKHYKDIPVERRDELVELVKQYATVSQDTARKF